MEPTNKMIILCKTLDEWYATSVKDSKHGPHTMLQAIFMNASAGDDSKINCVSASRGERIGECKILKVTRRTRT
jgi:hypothetical protein